MHPLDTDTSSHPPQRRGGSAAVPVAGSTATHENHGSTRSEDVEAANLHVAGSKAQLGVFAIIVLLVGVGLREKHPHVGGGVGVLWSGRLPAKKTRSERGGAADELRGHAASPQRDAQLSDDHHRERGGRGTLGRWDLILSGLG